MAIELVSSFLTPLVAKKIAPRTWELFEELEYISKLYGGIIRIPKGFVTDFASIPRWIPFAEMLVGDTAEESAVVHDLAYQTHLVSKTIADRIFLEAMKSQNIPLYQRSILYAGVSVGGWSSYKSGPQRFTVLNS